MIRSLADRSPHASRLAAAVALAVCLAPLLAGAQDRAAARRHFTEAERRYAASDWAGALTEYEAANAAAPMPEFLYNMAQCHRQLGHPTEAMDLYQRFLLERPDAPNRQTVEDLIDEVRAQAAAASQPPPTPTPAPAPAPEETPPPAATTPEPATPAPSDSRSPLARVRLLTWAALGGSAVLLGVSGLFALDASDAESDLAAPSLNCKARLQRCLDLQDRGDRSSVLRNTFFLIGLAGLAGTGVLAALDLTRGGADDRVALVVPALASNGFGLVGVFTWQ